jgi:preprotein translocase subunit SecY
VNWGRKLTFIKGFNFHLCCYSKWILIFYLKAYFYNTELINLAFIASELVCGAMIIVWLSSIIDNKGIGQGTSLIIFTNIVVTLISKNLLNTQQFDQILLFKLRSYYS